jgi:hypothetical protein
LIKEVLINQFFKPAMTGVDAGSAVGAARSALPTTANTSRGSAGAGTRVEVGFQLQYRRDDELKEADYDFSEISAQTRTHAPNGFFSAMLTPAQRAAQIRTIDLDDPFFKVIGVDVSTSADFAALDLKTIVVDLQYGGTVDQPDVIASVVLTPQDHAPKHFQAFRNGDDVSWRYQITYDFGQSPDIGAQKTKYQTDWQTSTSRALVVDPPADLPMLQVFLEPGAVDWDVVDTIETTLAYDDAANSFSSARTFLVRQTNPTPQEWLVRLTDGMRTAYAVSYLWRLRDATQIPEAPEEASGAHLTVRDPFTDRLPITIEALVDRANVARVDIELTYDDAHSHLNVHKSIQITGPDFAPAHVTIPIVDPRRRQYTYQATLIKPNAAAESQPPVQTDRLAINITEGGIYLDVTITVLGDLGSAGLDAVQVDLRSEPLDGAQPHVETTLFQPNQAAQAVKRLLLRTDRPQQFEFRTTAFRTAGDPVVSAWTAHDGVNLVIQPSRLLAH